jgi:hypothetical protein
VNATFEPREVEKPFARRWLRASFALILRSPIRFGMLIALLGWLDTSAVYLARESAVEWTWLRLLGSVILPILWVLVSAVARGADDHRQTWPALAQLGRKPVWIGALAAGAELAAFWTLFGFLDAVHVIGTTSVLHKAKPFLQHQGEFLLSIEASVMMLSIDTGLCYLPLLVFVPDVSPRRARQLSKKATHMNGYGPITMLIFILVIGAMALASAVPAYGMTTAAFLVFLGVLNYVAYRDIFERRSGNLPEHAAEPQVAGEPKMVRGAVLSSITDT